VEPQGTFEKTTGRFWQFAPKAALVVSVLVVAVAARNRLPWSDEGLFSSASYNLAHHGFLGTTVLESAGTGLTRIERHTYWVMPLYLLGQALWYKFVPASVLLTRTFTLLCVPLALWAFHVFLSRLLPQTRTPALGVSLLALFHLPDNAGFARPGCCAARLVTGPLLPDGACEIDGSGAVFVQCVHRCQRLYPSERRLSPVRLTGAGVVV
jgi:hypothetical protein